MVWSWSIRIGIVSCRLRFLAIVQDVLQRCICNRVKVYCFLASPFDSGVTVGSRKVYYSHAGFICLLLKIHLFEKRVNKDSGIKSDSLSLISIVVTVIRAEFSHSPMVRRHMLSLGNIPLATEVPLMYRDPLAFFCEDLNLLRKSVQYSRLIVILIRHRVVELIVFYMIIVRYLLYRLCNEGLKWILRKRTQVGFIQCQINTFAAAIAMLKITLG